MGSNREKFFYPIFVLNLNNWTRLFYRTSQNNPLKYYSLSLFLYLSLSLSIFISLYILSFCKSLSLTFSLYLTLSLSTSLYVSLSLLFPTLSFSRFLSLLILKYIVWYFRLITQKIGLFNYFCWAGSKIMRRIWRML